MEDRSSDSVTLPDTLFLRDRATEALNALTQYVDEDADCRPYMTGDLSDEPAHLGHSGWDFGSSVGRMVSAFVLARKLCDTADALDVEERFRQKLLDMFDEDGLNYREETDTSVARANMHDQRSVLLGLTTWYLESGDPDTKAAADNLCAALKRISVKSGHPHLAKQDYWYFPAVEYTRDGWPSEDMMYLGINIDPSHTSARMINPLTKYYEETGNRDALELARNFARHTVIHSGSFNEDGSFNDGTEFRTGHFHSRMVSVTSIARFGAVTGNAFYVNWAKKVYEWALTQGTEFGWFPSALHDDYDKKHETCTLTDMVELGILLAENGYVEYWETVERFVRNHLVETQLLDTDWIVESEDEAADDAYRNVASRSRGTFPGWAAPNDFVCDVGDDPDVMMCCNASGTRGLFLAWDNAVTESEGIVSVNLLINNLSEWATVASYLPHEGRIDVTLERDAPELRIRIPSWVDPYTVSLTQDGDDRELGDEGFWEGPFIGLHDVSGGERVSVRFPVDERRTVERAGGEDYTMEWRGDDVMSISPSGTYAPLYEDRDVYDEVPMRTVDCDNGHAEVHW
ncbi:glycoside hydrolase family 127 protein [Halobacteria archaeon AArc-m2/3/4]|uniref:Glycoside hydrolase family 127 protein n=1 Tax=Natronoglomus mannanivorans TaxID=2979990 RepID=A0ABT2QKM0_9EURY|nr:glycoside hydrolase family 127 protein [Halobacteria archaeon AArc-m2/3/4]